MKLETITCACGCGTEINKYDSQHRPRKMLQGHQNGNPQALAEYRSANPGFQDGSKNPG